MWPIAPDHDCPSKRSRTLVLRTIRIAGALLLLVSPCSWLMAASKSPAVAITPVISAVTTASRQPIILPRGAARLIVSTYVIAPGAKLPVHRHVYPRYAYVLDGWLRVTDTKARRTFDYKKGDFVVEMVGRKHFGENVGGTPLRLLVIDIVPRNVRRNSEP